MDEVLFHATETLEALQLQLLTGFHHSREFFHGYTEQFQSLSGSPVAIHIQNSFHQVWQFFHRILHEIKDITGSVTNPQQFFTRILPLFGLDNPGLSAYYGSLGFVVGAGVGLVLGLSWQRPAPLIQKMRAVVCTSYTGVDALALVDDVPCPAIHNGDEVMVQVKAASVDPIDVSICWGFGRVLRQQLNRYNPNVNSEFPVILGRDCAGVIVELGQNVTRFELGDEVWFSLPFWASGVLAEYVVVKQNLISHKPKGVTFEVAASLPYSGMLAWEAMVEQAGLNAKTCHGRRVLIHTGCSPVGCLLVQLAHLWGAHVTVTCPLRATPVAQALGADCIVVCGNGTDVEQQLLQMERFDCVFNTVGGVAHELCLKFCREDGHVITAIATPLASDTYGFFLGFLYSCLIRLKHITHKLVGATTWHSAHLNPLVLEHLGAMVETGGLQPVVDKIFTPQDAELAFQHVDMGDSIGKTVIRFRSRKHHSPDRKRFSKQRKSEKEAIKCP